MISVVILTFNEASNLPRCLASVNFSDDILVVDSGSSDATVALAEDAGARVVIRPFDSFAAQRNFAMTQDLRYPWTLHLDADETVTPELREELRQVLMPERAPFPVYKVPSRLMFMGRWLRYAGMYPTYQVRFGRTAELRFLDYGHGQREVQEADEVGVLRAPLEHHNFSKGINDWFRRHLRYARLEAEQALAPSQAWSVGELLSADPTRRRRALKGLSSRLPMRPWLRFFYTYILCRGFLDGRAGLEYSRLLATYQYLIDLNMHEISTSMSEQTTTRSSL